MESDLTPTFHIIWLSPAVTHAVLLLILYILPLRTTLPGAPVLDSCQMSACYLLMIFMFNEICTTLGTPRLYGWLHFTPITHDYLLLHQGFMWNEYLLQFCTLADGIILNGVPIVEAIHPAIRLLIEVHDEKEWVKCFLHNSVIKNR